MKNIICITETEFTKFAIYRYIGQINDNIILEIFSNDGINAHIQTLYRRIWTVIITGETLMIFDHEGNNISTTALNERIDKIELIGEWEKEN